MLLPRRASGTVISATLLLIRGEVLRVRMLLKLDDGLGEARASAVRQLQAIAADLRITQDHLHDVTSQAARTSPLVIIDDRSIFEGQPALSPTDKRIAQVSFDCGFADAAHFSRFFGLAHGYRPTPSGTWPEHQSRYVGCNDGPAGPMDLSSRVLLPCEASDWRGGHRRADLV